MNTRQVSTSVPTAKTVGQPCPAQNIEEHADELHIGIDEVLGMRVGCWRPPVYLGTSVPSTNGPIAHRSMVRFQSRQFERRCGSKDIFDSRSA
jgi:hypothetical protein